MPSGNSNPSSSTENWESFAFTDSIALAFSWVLGKLGHIVASTFSMLGQLFGLN